MSKTSPLSLYVPEPECRPGDAPDYSGVEIAAAGTVERPPIDADADDIRDLAYPIIRVMNRHGAAVGPWANMLTSEQLRDGLRDMLKVRAFDARMHMAQRQGKTSFYMQCLGEEAIACAFRKALSRGDMNFPTYRQQGLLLATDYPIVDMMNQIYSNARDPLKGRERARLFHRFGQSCDTVHAGRRLGDGISDRRRYENSRGLDRRRLNGGIRFSFGAGVCVLLSRAGGVEHCQ